MGLFGKKIGDTEWRNAAKRLVAPLSEVCEALEFAGRCVQGDPLNGWRSAPIMANLKPYEETVKAVRKALKGIGDPQGADPFVLCAKPRMKKRSF